MLSPLINETHAAPAFSTLSNHNQPMEFWAFLENSDFQRRKRNGIYRQDEVRLIRHDEFLEVDYQLMRQIGCVGVRDAARWYITHPHPDIFNWVWMDRMVHMADQYNLKMYIDLWHYGYPDWLDLMSPDAPLHFASFAREIALRYPSIQHFCVSNEPSLLVELGGRLGKWRPFQRQADPTLLRRQISRMIIEASKAILKVRPDALLIIPEPWHSTLHVSEDHQAAVIDTVLGLRDPHLGGQDDLINVIGLNHYRDSTLPPFHRLIMNARRRWPNKELWLTETSGPPRGWDQAEWFWWMMAETRLANMEGAGVSAFTWAPIISMYDWVDERIQLHNGFWKIGANGERIPNGHALEALALAREYGYLC